MKQIIKNYTFDKTAKTITFTDFNTIRLAHILMITNVTSNVIIYQFNNPAKGGSVATNVLTLDYDTSAMDNADKLQIIYAVGEDGVKHAGVNDNILGKVDGNIVYLEDDFGGSSLDANNWDLIQTGAGHTVSVTSGLLRIATGTTINTETIIRSKKQFIGASTLRFSALLSQRIINQNFYVELADTSGNTYMQWDFSGAVNTTARAGTMIQGFGLQNAATTTNATSAQQTFEILRTEKGIQFATNTANTNTTSTNRANMTYGHPPLDMPLYIQIRAKNLGTAPATSTNFDIEKISMVNMNNLKVAVMQGEGNQSMNNALPVNVLNTQTVSGTVTVNQGTTSATPWAVKPNAATGTGYTPAKYISAATTNATVVKASAGTLGFISASNISTSARYVKIYNKATAPTVGTDVPVQTYMVPPNTSGTNLALPASGLNLSTGICFAITGGYADTDTTATAVGDVILNYGTI